MRGAVPCQEKKGRMAYSQCGEDPGITYRIALMASSSRTTRLPSPLRGVIPPLATPLLDADRLDPAGLDRLIEHVLAGGVHGLFILGTTGEGPSLSYALRRQMIDRTCATVAGRKPVLVGITDTALPESLDLAHHAARAGADACVLAAPFYFPAGQAEILHYLQQLIPRLPLPVFLYHMPSHTKIAFDPDTVRQAAEMPNLVGLKDSSSNMIYFRRVQSLMRDRPDFALLVGPDELLGEATLLGGHGGVNGGANLFPRLYVDLYNAASAHDLPKTAELSEIVLRVSTTIYRAGPQWSSYLVGLKCALACMGICGESLAPPFRPFGEDERKKIRGYVEEIRARLGK